MQVTKTITVTTTKAPPPPKTWWEWWNSLSTWQKIALVSASSAAVGGTIALATRKK